MHFSAESKRAPSYFPLKRGPLNPLKGRRKQVNENENEKICEISTHLRN